MTSRRRTHVLAVLSLLLVALTLSSAPVGATTRSVVVDNMAFSPSSTSVVLGDTVKWSFRELHTTTSDQGFWNSGNKSAGTSYSRTFPDAGTYPYHCTLHPDMHGKVLGRMRFSGTSSQGYTVRWSSRTSTPSTVRFDVQYKRVGVTSWSNLRTGTASRTTTFNPSGAHSYYLRARTHSGTHTSSWSPSITLKIT